jgi:hypothetical protein
MLGTDIFERLCSQLDAQAWMAQAPAHVWACRPDCRSRRLLHLRWALLLRGNAAANNEADATPKDNSSSRAIHLLLRDSRMQRPKLRVARSPRVHY